MHLTLYNLAGLAMVGWLLVMFLPAWRVTRWLVESAVFPVYLSVLYVVGITVVLRDTGPGLMSEFGSADGVLRILARPDVALIAWIHILAFDQLVGLWIYRDNMRHRYVPIVLQSVLLFFTLMLGPLGFVTYFVLRGARRAARRDGPRIALRTVDPFPDAVEGVAKEVGGPRAGIAFAPAEPAGVLDDRLARLPSPVDAPFRYARAVWLEEERGIAAMGALGILLAAGIGVVWLVHGPVIEPEGVLSKPLTFDLAVGIYTLTLALMVPLARFPQKALRRWRATTIVFMLIGFSIETVQSLRGLDPRFSRVAGPVDQAIGVLFLTFAIVTMILFWILAVRFFDLRREGAERTLVLGVRYACLATALAFVGGIAMSVLNSRFYGESGNLLTIHALGFHGLQAIPLVAILAIRGNAGEVGRGWVHAAGLLWLGTCLLVGLQTRLGLAVTVPTGVSAGAGFLLIVWAGLTVTVYGRSRAGARQAAGR